MGFCFDPSKGPTRLLAIMRVALMKDFQAETEIVARIETKIEIRITSRITPRNVLP
jgi:hypothetical protein